MQPVLGRLLLMPSNRLRQRKIFPTPHLKIAPLWGGVGGGGHRATTATPTQPAFAALWRATLPTRGRVRPSSPLVLIALHQTCSNRRIPGAQRFTPAAC